MRIRIKYFALLLLLAAIQVSAQTDTVHTAEGVWHYHERRAEIPWDIHVLKIHLAHPEITAVTGKAHDLLKGLETTSSIAGRYPGEVIAAVNADFFNGDGIPVGAQVADGALLKNPGERSVFALTENDRPYIGTVHFSGYLTTPEKIRYPLRNINGARDKDCLVMYSAYAGKVSPANRWGTELVAMPLDPPSVNRDFRVRITDRIGLLGTVQKPTRIPPEGFIISGHGKAKRFLDDHTHIGDTLSIRLQLDPLDKPVRTLVGGLPRIIRDGKISVENREENIYEAFRTTRHPRTAAGYSANGDTLYLVVVDGRQQRHSIGMSLDELAEYMLKLGAHEAVNLDGGGSSTMIVSGKTVNRPSDATGERAVSNALIIIRE